MESLRARAESAAAAGRAAQTALVTRLLRRANDVVGIGMRLRFLASTPLASAYPRTGRIRI